MFSEGIYKNYKKALVDNSKAMNNLGSGKKINCSKDNPNKMAQSVNLKISLLCRDAANKNIQDTNSMIQTFDGGLQEINNNLSRLKDLTVKSGSGANSPEDEQIIQKEIAKIKEDINYLADSTSFNDIKLSDSSVTNNAIPNSKESTIGALPDEKVNIPFFNVSTNGLQISGIDVTNTANLGANLKAVDDAIVTVTSIRSQYGAIQSRLSGTADGMSEMDQSINSSLSNIEDADIAEESLEYSRTQIKYQAAIALMAQSNKLPQDALNILASVR